MYRPPWPTQLDSGKHWEAEHVWESHVGSVIDRLTAAGRAERSRSSKYQIPQRGFASNAWKATRRLGAEILDLRGRFRSVNTRNVREEVLASVLKTDKDWDTTTWSPTDLAIASDVLIDAFVTDTSDDHHPAGCRSRRDVAVYLLSVLLQRHKEFMLPYLERLTDDLMARGLRMPERAGLAPDIPAVRLLAALTPMMGDKYIRSLAMNKAVATCLYEHSLCARRIQNAWAIFKFYKWEAGGLVARARRRREMNLCISRYWLKVAWVWMKKGDTEGVVTADTLSALLGFISEMVSPGTRGRKKNTLRFEANGGLYLVLRCMTHAHNGIRRKAAEITLRLAMTTWFRPTLLVHGIDKKLLELLYASGGGCSSEHARVFDTTTTSEVANDSSHQLPPSQKFVDLTVDDRLHALEILDLLYKGIGDDGAESDDGGLSSADEGDFEDDGNPFTQSYRSEALASTSPNKASSYGDDTVRKPRQNYEIGWDSEDSEEERFDEAADIRLREQVGTGEGFAGREKTYDEKVAILRNRAASKDGKPAPTLSHERVRRRLRYLEAVRLEQGPGVIQNPPRYPVTAKELGAYSVTKPYCIGIAVSEPVLKIEGPAYWDVIAHPDIVRRLVQLLSASDSSTRMGASMALSKLAARDSLADLVIKTCVRKPHCFDGLVSSLAREEPLSSTAAMVLMRTLLSREKGRLRLLKTGMIDRLMETCDSVAPQSLTAVLCLHCLVAFAFPYARGPTEDALPISLSATFGELTMSLSRSLLQLLMASADQTAATTEAFVRIGVVRQLALYCCQGIEPPLTVSSSIGQLNEYDGLHDAAADEESEVVVATPTLQRSGLIENPDFDAKKETNGPTEPDPHQSYVSDGEPSLHRSLIEPDDEVKSVDSAEDLRDDGVLDFGLPKRIEAPLESDRKTGLFTRIVRESIPHVEDSVDMDALNVLDMSGIDAHELRYIGSVFLEKLTTDDRCAPILCTDRMIRHLSSLLAVARAEVDECEGELSVFMDRATLTVQCVCKAFCNFLSCEAVLPEQKDAVIAAVLEPETVANIAVMFSVRWEQLSSSRLQLYRKEKRDASAAAISCATSVDTALMCPAQGSAKEQAEAIKAAKLAADAAKKRAVESEQEYDAAKLRRRDDEEAILFTVKLIAAAMPAMPDVISDELDRFRGPGDPDQRQQSEIRLRDSLVAAVVGSSDATGNMGASGSSEDFGIAELEHVRASHAVQVCAPDLMLLAARTSNLRIRNAALFTLSAFAYSPSSAQLLIRLGGLELVLAFFPFCINPTTRQVIPDLCSVEAFPQFEVAPTRASGYDGASSATPSSIASYSRVVPTIEDAALATAGGNFNPGTVFSRLPAPLFTLLASLARYEPVREDICKSGLFQTCIDRFVLETEDPNLDLKTQAEIAILLSRFASRSFPGFGSANDSILGKQRTCTPDALSKYRFRLLESCEGNDDMSAFTNPVTAETVNLVIAGLVNLVGLRTHNRLLYNGVLCLANIAQDALRSVPILVEEGILAALVPLIQDRATSPIILRHAIRCVSCIGLGASPQTRRRMVSLRVMLHLQRIGIDTQRIQREREEGFKWTCPDLARVACDHIGEEFSEYSGSLYREDAQKPSSYVAQTSSGRQVASPARTANKALLSSFTDGSVENDAISPLAGGALSRSTLPSVQNLLKHLSSPKTKAAPSYRKLATQGDEELFVLPEIRPRSSGREPAAPSPAKASHAVGLSGFLLDPVFSSSNSCVVPKGEPLLPSNSSLRHSKPQSKSSKVVVIPATRRK